jgi:hypothetical protein
VLLRALPPCPRSPGPGSRGRQRESERGRKRGRERGTEARFVSEGPSPAGPGPCPKASLELGGNNFRSVRDRARGGAPCGGFALTSPRLIAPDHPSPKTSNLNPRTNAFCQAIRCESISTSVERCSEEESTVWWLRLDLSTARRTRPSTRTPTPFTLHHSPKPRNPEPETQNPKPETRNLKPETRNPKPET